MKTIESGEGEIEEFDLQQEGFESTEVGLRIYVTLDVPLENYGIWNAKCDIIP